MTRSPNPKARPHGPRRPPPAPGAPSRAARWLGVLTLGLLGLIVASRWARPPAPAPAAELAPAPSGSPVGSRRALASSAPRTPPPQMVAAPTLGSRGPTPTIDLMVRLEASRRIARAGRAVYLDSALAASDSVLRRWPTRPGQPVTVAFARDSLVNAGPVAADVVRAAFERWAQLALGLRFTFLPDTLGAEITVRWIDQFDPAEQRTGQADLEVTATGDIHRARITLALRLPDGRALDRAGLLVSALHEVGHALGLGHSDSAGDVMFASPTAASLSDRDRRTAELIYGLPPGSVRTGQQ